MRTVVLTNYLTVKYTHTPESLLYIYIFIYKTMT